MGSGFFRGCLASGEAGGVRVGAESNRAEEYKATTRVERATSVLALEKGSNVVVQCKMYEQKISLNPGQAEFRG